MWRSVILIGVTGMLTAPALAVSAPDEECPCRQAANTIHDLQDMAVRAFGDARQSVDASVRQVRQGVAGAATHARRTGAEAARQSKRVADAVQDGATQIVRSIRESVDQ